MYIKQPILLLLKHFFYRRNINNNNKILQMKFFISLRHIMSSIVLYFEIRIIFLDKEHKFPRTKYFN